MLLGLRVMSYMDSTTVWNLLLAAISMHSCLDGCPPVDAVLPGSFQMENHHFWLDYIVVQNWINFSKVFCPIRTEFSVLIFTCKYTIQCTPFCKSIDDFNWSMITGVLWPTSDCQYCLIPPFQHTYNLFSCELRTIVCVVEDVWISNHSKERI